MSHKSADQLKAINGVLNLLSKDDDLKDDLKLPAVKVAIDHWTGKNRLDAEQANKLQNNRRVIYVLQRFQMLQSVCKEALMPVPLDHLLLGKATLDNVLVKQFFPALLQPAESQTISLRNDNKLTATSSTSEEPVVAAKHDHNAVCQTTPQSSSAPIQQISSSARKNGMDINSMLKIAIAVVFILIAITLAQLYNR